MEDLDAGRVRPGIAEQQLADLRALGIDWDGEVVFQSQRTALYESALARLDTYPCYCTRREIREAPSAPHAPVGWYPGTCRDRIAPPPPGRPPALRLRGDRATDDFVLRRNDGAFAYNLAVVVDDIDQGIEEVVRGEDLLDTMPRQLALYDRLGAPPPHFVHVPLMYEADGKRMAKRDASRTLEGLEPGEAIALMASDLLATAP